MHVNNLLVELCIYICKRKLHNICFNYYVVNQKNLDWSVHIRQMKNVIQVNFLFFLLISEFYFKNDDFVRYSLFIV